jgi:hypothetical protein
MTDALEPSAPSGGLSADPSRSRRRSRRFGLAAAALGIGLGLAVVEAVVRVASLDWRLIEPYVAVQNADPGAYVESDDGEMLYALRPDQHREIAVPGGGGTYLFHTNSLGYRDVERTAHRPPGVTRIMALGGSNTFGAGVGNPETWPAQLERALAEALDRPIEVWNLGHSGYMTRQKLAQGRRALAFEPDLFVLQIYNVGPRCLLADTDHQARLRRQPALYREYLVQFPSAGSLAAVLWDGSASFRLAWTVRDRRLRSGQQAGENDGLTPWNRAEAGDASHLRRFLADVDVPLVGLLTPEGQPSRLLEETGIPVIRLDQLDQPFGEGGLEIHPEPEVLAWYGDRIAEALIAEGCFTEEPGLPLPCYR